MLFLPVCVSCMCEQNMHKNHIMQKTVALIVCKRFLSAFLWDSSISRLKILWEKAASSCVHPVHFFLLLFQGQEQRIGSRPLLGGRAVRYTISTGRYNMISLPRGGPVQFDFSRTLLLRRTSTTTILRCVATAVLSRTGTMNLHGSCCTFGQGHEQNVAFRYRICNGIGKVICWRLFYL